MQFLQVYARMGVEYHLTPENKLVVPVIVYTHTEGVLSNAVRALRKLKVENITGHTYGGAQTLGERGFKNFVGIFDLIPWLNPKNYPRLVYGLMAALCPALPPSSVEFVFSLHSPGASHAFEGPIYYNIAREHLKGSY